MDTVSRVNKKLKQTKEYISWDKIVMSVYVLVSRLMIACPELPKYVCGLPRGGLIPAVLISHRLDIPLVTEHDIENDDINFGDVLLVDDIADSGRTLQRFLYNRKKPFGVYTICYKEKSKVVPEYYSINVDESIWIVFPWEVEQNVR